MQSITAPNRTVASAQAASFTKETEPALRVATVYQDPLTRHWARELWDRVGQLVGQGGICHQSWKIGDLTDAQASTGAVQAAPEADVLVVSVRDAGELPINLCVWIDAWMPRRAGALVALIGVCPQPNVQSGRVHAYLEAVARRVGLDFLPRERKLPEHSRSISRLARSTQLVEPTMPWLCGAPSLRAGAPLRWGLT